MRLRWILASMLTVSVVAVALAVRDRTPLRSEYCTAQVADYAAQIDLEQAQWISLMSAVSERRGLPARATTIAIATAFQESKARNIDYGDRDSLGLFQQRPSQGWGSAEQIMDPLYAIGQFYDALIKVPDYQNADITVAAQAVQRSAFPEAYAQHEPRSRALASALRGFSPAAFSCQLVPQGPGNVNVVVDDFTAAFGPTPASTSDDLITLSVGGQGDQAQALAWSYAHYAVANAARLRISEVTVAGKQWTAEDSDQGWVPAAENRTEVTISTR